MKTSNAQHPAPPQREKNRCSCPACQRGLKPFTLAHFRAWSAELILDTDEPWVLEQFQGSFVRDLFLHLPENWFVVPEGNAKTTLLAGVGLYHAEHVTDAWVPVGASSRDQARILYRQAAGFVRRTPRLEKVFRCFDGYRRIVHHATRGTVEVFANDDRTGDGVIPTLALIDELHRHRDMSLYLTWRGKLGKRKGQLATISTAGEPGSEFEQVRERIRQQATNVTRRGCFTRAASASLVMHEWAVPEDGDVEDITLVKRANPLKAITKAALKEKLTSPTMTLAHWRRFTCNLPTRGEQAAITEIEWAKARTSEGVPEGAPIWLGLDVAWKWDTTAAVPLLDRGEDGRLLGPATILVPPRDGSMLEVGDVQAALRAIHARNPIHTVVMDTTRAEDLAQWIRDELVVTVLDRGQTPTFAVEEYETFMVSLRTGLLRHTGDEGLTAHTLNAVARQNRYGAVVFDRPVTTRTASDLQDIRVIDALKAAAMVNAQAMVQAPVAEGWFVNA